jgi:imidazolonepropionase-like amidohydrolase
MSKLILRGGLVWDGTAASASEGVVVSEGEHIAASDGASGRTLDVSGCTVMPGLIEGHAHLCFDATPGWKSTYDSDSSGRMLLRMASNGRKMLQAGITTVRDLGAPTLLAVELRDASLSGLTQGPRLLVSGSPITTTGGHCWFMGGECDGEIGLRRNVREHVKAGTDWIKVMATGGNMTPRTNTFAAQFTVVELRACIEEAHRLRRKVAAHAHGVEGIRVAVAAGVDCIEHCSFTTPGGYEFDQSLIDKIASKGILVSPTVSVGFRNWPDDGRRRQRGDVLKALLDSGCKVLMSTDCGIPGVPHEALAGGMEVLAEATGYPAVEILKLATSRSAELLELPDRGVIEPGRLADLLVVEGNPTEDLSTLNNVRYVIHGGEIVFAAQQFAIQRTRSKAPRQLSHPSP